jgi:hypothetical protein
VIELTAQTSFSTSSWRLKSLCLCTYICHWLFSRHDVSFAREEEFFFRPRVTKGSQLQVQLTFEFELAFAFTFHFDVPHSKLPMYKKTALDKDEIPTYLHESCKILPKPFLAAGNCQSIFPLRKESAKDWLVRNKIGYCCTLINNAPRINRWIKSKLECPEDVDDEAKNEKNRFSTLKRKHGMDSWDLPSEQKIPEKTQTHFFRWKVLMTKILEISLSNKNSRAINNLAFFR